MMHSKTQLLTAALAIGAIVLVQSESQAQPGRGGRPAGGFGGPAGQGGGSLRYGPGPNGYNPVTRNTVTAGNLRYGPGYVPPNPVASRGAAPQSWANYNAYQNYYNYVLALPPGARNVMVAGNPYYYANGVYYQPTYYQGQMVYQQVNPASVTVPREGPQQPPPDNQPAKTTDKARPAAEPTRRTVQVPDDPPPDPEKSAAASLKLIRLLIDDNQKESAAESLEELIKKYPGTSASQEASRLLKELNK